MKEYITFSLYMLRALAEFLGAEPITWLFGLVLLCFLVKAVKILIS